MRDIYINSNLKPLTKFTSSSRSTEFKDILPWSISQMISKIIPNQHENSLHNETGHPVLSLWEIQWKLRQQHDQNFPIGRKAIVAQILASEEINKSKRAGLRVTVRDPSRKVTI